MENYFFIDQKGNLIPLADVKSSINCKHNFVDGYVKKHKK